jgi:hypothetical protein
MDVKVSEIDPWYIGEKKYSIFSTEYFWAMFCQVSVEHDNNFQGELCQVTRLPTNTCRRSEDERKLGMTLTYLIKKKQEIKKI